jgi:hypothetical protein
MSTVVTKEDNLSTLQQELEELRKDSGTLSHKMDALKDDNSEEFAKLTAEYATLCQHVITLDAKAATLKKTSDLLLASVNPLMLPFLRNVHVAGGGQMNRRPVTGKKPPVWTYMHHLVDGVQRLIAVGGAHQALSDETISVEVEPPHNHTVTAGSSFMGQPNQQQPAPPHPMFVELPADCFGEGCGKNWVLLQGLPFAKQHHAANLHGCCCGSFPGYTYNA